MSDYTHRWGIEHQRSFYRATNQWVSTFSKELSGLFKKETNNNILTDAHIDKIMQVFDSKENVDYLARSVPFEEVAGNDYNLSVSSYV